MGGKLSSLTHALATVGRQASDARRCACEGQIK